MEEDKKNNRATQFIRNMGIYAIGGVGSRLITFLLVPIYSFFIAPEDFGYYDICFATVLFLLPLISLDFRDGVLRFLIDAESEEERSKIVTMSMMTLLTNSAISISLGVLVNLLIDIKYLWYTVAFAISFSVYEVVTQMLRALGHSKLFAVTGILSSFLVFAVSVPLVVFTDMGIEGVFIGNIVARVVALTLAEIKVKIFSQYIVLHTDVREVRKKIMKFSLPLVVVNVVVWGIGSGNRYFISNYLGLYDNGLYAVAVKFAAILETLTLIFNQTWQETAFRQYSDTDKNEFYTKIINSYIWFLVMLVVGISYGVRLVYGYIVGAEYQGSVMLVFPLVTSSMVFSIMTFYDMGYQCSKQTMRPIPSLLIGLLMSVFGNYFFIQLLGLYGAILSQLTTYVSLLIYKMIDTRKYMQLYITKNSIGALLVLVGDGIIYYFIESAVAVAFVLIVSLAIISMLCPQYMRQEIKKRLRVKTTINKIVE